MHKNKICQMLIINILLLILCISLNVIPVSANHLNTINNYMGANRSFIYKNRVIHVTNNQLNKKLNLVINLLKHKDSNSLIKNNIELNPKFSLFNIHVVATITISIFIIGIFVYIYIIRIKRRKRQIRLLDVSYMKLLNLIR